MTTRILTKSSEQTIEEHLAQEICVHHWIIEPPTGPTSKGVCKLCGAEKDFANHPPKQAKEQHQPEK